MANRRLSILWFMLFSALTGIIALAQTPYANATYGFVVTPPAGWTQTSVPGALVTYMEPLAPQVSAMRPAHETNAQFIARISRSAKQKVGAQGAYRANILVTTAPTSAATVKDYARITRAKSVHMNGYRIIGEVPTTLGSMAAIRRTIRLKSPAGALIQTCEVTCMRRGRLVTITLTAPYQKFSQYVPVYNKVLTSFTWKSHI